MLYLLNRWPVLGLLLLVGGALALPAAQPPEPLVWNTNRNLVTADIKAARLVKVLERVSVATGWRVFVEPEAVNRKVSAKFSELPPGEALRLMLGDLNFALVPATNNRARLFVFQTSRQNATQLVSNAPASNVITNELIVRLKPGEKIDDLARRLGARIVGRIDGMNAYRLRFENETATETARTDLAGNSAVESVDSNFSLDRPFDPRPAPATGVPPPQLQLKPPPDDGRVIVGLVDTAVQRFGNNLDGFVLKQLSVADGAQADQVTPSHGTSMAETILRSLQMATKGSTSVQILPVDVYGGNTTTTTFDVATGITQAINGGAKIVNLSLGTESDSPFLRQLIQEASGKNILIFAAAGNEPVTTPYYPAAYPGATAVTAVDQGQIASYANRGSFVSVGAPGTSVIYYNNQAYYVVGTSASAAFTSGLAAGYMDATGSTPQQAQTFVLNKLGLKPALGQ